MSKAKPLREQVYASSCVFSKDPGLPKNYWEQNDISPDCKINLASFARYFKLSAGKILYILGSDYPILQRWSLLPN